MTRQSFFKENNKEKDEKIVTYDTLNRSIDDEKISYKEEKKLDFDIKILGGVLAAALGLPFLYTIAQGNGRNAALRCYVNERDNFDSIIICNGEYIITYDITKNNFMSNNELSLLPKDIKYEYHNTINNVEYEINYMDDKSLVLYTYGLDDSIRKTVTDYIASNIIIDENNIVYLDEEDLSEQGYNEYVTSVLNNSNQTIQRVREN